MALLAALGSAVAACGGGDSSNGQAVDASTDSLADAMASPDATDSSKDATDASKTEASADAGADVAAHDGSVDAPSDAPSDANGGSDAIVLDAPTDGPAEGSAPSTTLFALQQFATVAVRADGTTFAWGWNGFGNLGDGTTTDRELPVQVIGVANPVSLGWGADSVGQCVAMADQTIRCWGFNQDGQLGNGTQTDQHTAVIPNINGVVALSDGMYDTCGLISDGTVECWGANPSGELGNGSSGPVSLTPVVVSNLSGVKALASGSGNTCALLSSGSVECWGWGGGLSLGNGGTGNQTTPVPVSNLTDAVSICISGEHACAARSGGGVVCWGHNGVGQLGNGTTTDSLVPVPVSNLTGAVQVGCGALLLVIEGDGATIVGSFSCARTQDGHVWCWGDNNFGEMGNGKVSATPALTPVEVSGLTAATALGVGGSHACALQSGHLYCWGNNANGQVGIGGDDAGTALPDGGYLLPVTTPTIVPGL
jgi:alpha-tubulin suppressor-like RCC1 family protein